MASYGPSHTELSPVKRARVKKARFNQETRWAAKAGPVRTSKLIQLTPDDDLMVLVDGVWVKNDQVAEVAPDKLTPRKRGTRTGR